MGRPFEMPDPKDRSVNEPHRMVERVHILGLYNQEFPGEQATYLSEKVRTWFEQQMREQGWSSVRFLDDVAVLEAKVQLVV